MAAVPDAYAAWFSAQGRHEEALSMARRAADLDPLSTSVQLDLGWYLYLARRQAEATAALRRAFELEGQAGCLDYAVRSRMAAGDWDGARAFALRVMEARAAPPAALAGVRAVADSREAVRQHLRWALERLESRGASKDALAIEYAWLGDDDMALRLLDAAFEDGGGWALCFLSVEPAWDRLRSRFEFQSLVARAGITTP
jgi:tetratricopeptide (TPR) repeat protein